MVNSRKLILSILLCGLTVFSAAASVSPPFSAPAPIAAEFPLEEQLEILYRNRDVWNCDDEYTEYSYAVTDFDGNGRLELFAAVTQGTGIFTYGRLYEINSAFDGLDQVFDSFEEPLDLPEVIVSSAEKYTDEDGTNYYVFENGARSGFQEFYTGKESFSLKDGSAVSKVFASAYGEYSDADGTYRMSYTDGDGNPVAEEYFNNAEESCFGGMAKSTVSFRWFTQNDGEIRSLLAESYKVFSGEIQPQT